MEKNINDIAFLNEMQNLVSKNMARIDLVVKNQNGKPLGDVVVYGITSIDGAELKTDDSGRATGYTTSRSVQIGVSDYADLPNSPITVSNEIGKRYDATLTLTQTNYINRSSSGNIRFSKYVKRVMYSVCGGGGGGSGYGVSGPNIFYYGGGGGGGHSSFGSLTPTPNTYYPVSIGAGGSATSPASNTPGGDGGTTTFNGTSARGGGGGGKDTSGNTSDSLKMNGGIGNGNGGKGGDANHNPSGLPTAGTEKYYTAYLVQGTCGGGGGGSYYYGNATQGNPDPLNSFYEKSSGGSPNGGNGACVISAYGYALYNKYRASSRGLSPGGGGGGTSIPSVDVYINGASTRITTYPSPGSPGGLALCMEFYEM